MPFDCFFFFFILDGPTIAWNKGLNELVYGERNIGVRVNIGNVNGLTLHEQCKSKGCFSLKKLKT